MNDETWQRELAEAARDELETDRAELDERWIRLSSGTLSEREEAELRALAETSPEARAAYEAFRPLGPDFKARTMKEIRKRIVPPAPVRATPRETRPWSLALPWKTPRFAGWMAAAGAMAAALAVVLLRAPGGSLPPLPEYEQALLGGVETMRGAQGGAPSGIRTFRKGSQLDLALTPLSAVQGEIAADCFFVRGRQLRSCKGSLRQVGQGSVQVVGTVGTEIPLDPGEWTLCAVVGWPRKLPDVAALCVRDGQESRPSRYWRSFKIPLRVE